MFDIGGFLTSSEFLGQFAALVATLLSSIAAQLIGNLFAAG